MKNINWKVRFKNKAFWIAVIPALLLLIQLILSLFGVDWRPEDLSDKLVSIVNAVFGLLAVLGVAIDPTTSGVSDSELALGYEEPN